MSAKFTAELDHFGSIKTVELIQGGIEKTVTLKDRDNYIEKMALFHLIGKKCKLFLKSNDWVLCSKAVSEIN